jgi:hypothetical protein
MLYPIELRALVLLPWFSAFNWDSRPLGFAGWGRHDTRYDIGQPILPQVDDPPVAMAGVQHHQPL